MNIDQNLTMTSREIAELTGKEHKNVKADAERMLETLEVDALTFQRIYKDSMNRSQVEYALPKDETLCLMAGYNVKARMTIIKRWQELESQAKPVFQLPDFTNPAIAARAWADEVEAKLKAIETIKQKDEIILAVADLNIKAGQVSIAEFAKNLAIPDLGQNNLYKWLKGRGFLQSNNHPYQQYVTRGYFVMKPYENKIKGEVVYKTLLTPRGTAWLSKMLHAEFELSEE